jgi:putative transposase
MSSTRNRTSLSYIGRALYLYFLGLSIRNAAKAMFCFRKVKRSHVAIWKWIQKYHPKKILSKRKRISEFIVDETLLKVGLEIIRLWVAIEPNNKQILTLSIFKGKQHAYC